MTSLQRGWVIWCACIQFVSFLCWRPLFCLKVIDRLSITCSPAKVEASKSVPYYQLGIGEGCEARVKSLFEKLSFHLPGTWGGRDGNVCIPKLLRQWLVTNLSMPQDWQPNAKEAFLSPALIATIMGAYFASQKSLGYRYLDKFTSTVPSKPTKKELPISLLALNMTAVGSCHCNPFLDFALTIIPCLLVALQLPVWVSKW